MLIKLAFLISSVFLLNSSFAIAATTSCSTVAACVMGVNTSTGYGIEGTSRGNDGVVGFTTENAISASTGKAGVAGYDGSTNKTSYNSGVYGASAYGDGVQGKALSGTGVLGSSSSGTGVIGKGGKYGGYFTASGGVGLYAAGARIANTATIDLIKSKSAAIGHTPVATGNDPIDVGPFDGLGGEYATPGLYATIRAYANSSNDGLADNLFIGVDCFSDPDYPTTRCSDTVSIDALGNAIFAGSVTQNGQAYVRTKRASGPDVVSFGARTAAPTIEDLGKAQLRGGAAAVLLDRTFASAIDPHSNYMVFITPEGDSNGLYTAQETSSGFVVRENKGGRSSLTFDYRIVAKPLDAKTMHLPAMSAMPQLALGSRGRRKPH